MNRLIFMLIGVAIITSCSNNIKKEEPAALPISEVQKAQVVDTFKSGFVYQNIKCIASPDNQFAFYLPANDSSKNKPVLFFFDAHGDPVLPLQKYKKLADEFGFILVGSYNSKNGNDWPTTEQIWTTLYTDVSNRLPINQQRIYTAGFSGGAKVASYIGLNHPNIAGVIANGAGFPETQTVAPANDFCFVGITGNGDMNMTELVALNQNLNSIGAPHQLLFFNGKHEWCPIATMKDAFLFLEFNAVKQNKAIANPEMISAFIAAHDLKINQFKKENDLLKYADENKLVANYLRGISNEYLKYESAYNAIIKNPVYQQQQKAYSNILQAENNIKSNLAATLQQNNDVAFWQKTISDLNKAAKANSDNGAMNKRIISYLSLAAYSFSNRALNTGDNETASRYVNLYKIIDPENSEADYFTAILAARNKNWEAVKAALQMAKKKGFIDEQRLKSQPEFAGMLDSIK